VDTPSSTQRLTAWIVSALFVVGIWLPLADKAFGIAPEIENTEKRAFAQMPEFPLPAQEGESELRTWLRSMRAWPQGFEAWYNDHFGFRNNLTRFHNVLQACWLGAAPNDKVILGKDGWLYYGGGLNVEMYRSESLMRPELVAGWMQYFQELSEFLDDHGSRFLLLIPTAKPTIHPEHLPDWIERVGETSRLDQLVSHLERDTDVWFLDLRDALFAGKQERTMYRKSDSHWNQHGSFVAYHRTVQELGTRFPTMVPHERSDFDLVELEMDGGDLAALMGLPDLYRVVETTYQSKREVHYRIEQEGLVPGTHRLHEPIASVHEDQSLPSGVLFHDSFGPQISEFLPPHFSRLVTYWQYEPLPEVVALEQPDVFIQEMGERVFIRDALKGETRPFQVDELIWIDFDRRRAFRSSDAVLFSLARPADRGAIVAGASSRPGASGGSILLGDADEAPSFELSSLPQSASGDRMLRFDLVAPATAAPRALVVSAGPTGPTDDGSGAATELLRRRLIPGRNIAYLRLPGSQDVSRLRVALEPPGEYELRGLEIRSVPVLESGEPRTE